MSGARNALPAVLAITLRQRHRVVVSGEFRVLVDAGPAEHPDQFASATARAAEQLALLLDSDEQRQTAVEVRLDRRASASSSSLIGRTVAIFLTGSVVSLITSVDSGFTAPSATPAASGVAVPSTT